MNVLISNLERSPIPWVTLKNVHQDRLDVVVGKIQVWEESKTKLSWINLPTNLGLVQRLLHQLSGLVNFFLFRRDRKTNVEDVLYCKRKINETLSETTCLVWDSKCEPRASTTDVVVLRRDVGLLSKTWNLSFQKEKGHELRTCRMWRFPNETDGQGGGLVDSKTLLAIFRVDSVW